MFSRLLCPVALAALAAACGGGGSVVIDVTDSPPDLGEIEHLYVTISSVEVHVVDRDADENGDPKDDSIDGDDNWQTVTTRAGTFDLVALQNDARAELGEVDLPDGKITQIRLYVDPRGKNVVQLKGGGLCKIDTSSRLSPTGVKIDHPFKALDPNGGRLHIVIDFDVKTSIDQAGDCNYILQPDIKIKSTDIQPAG